MAAMSKPCLTDGIAARVYYSGTAVEFYEPMGEEELAALLNYCCARVYPGVEFAQRDEAFERVMARRKQKT
jgi:hypothetical protein